MFLLASVLCWNAIASIEGFKLDHTNRSLRRFSLKEAYEKHFGTKPLLASVERTVLINCMGRTFNPRQLCATDSVLSGKFTRALISNDQQSVICEFAKHVKLNLNCAHTIIKGRCDKSAKSACSTLKESYAADLTLHHSAVIPFGTNQKLVDCQFSAEQF